MWKSRVRFFQIPIQVTRFGFQIGLLGLLACCAQNSQKDFSGHYFGTWSRYLPIEDQRTVDADLEYQLSKRVMGSGKNSERGNWEVQWKLKIQSQNPIQISGTGNEKSMEVQAQDLGLGVQVIQSSPKMGCMANRILEVCLIDGSLRLTLQSFGRHERISLDKSSEEKASTRSSNSVAISKIYEADELLKMAANQSFDSQEQYWQYESSRREAMAKLKNTLFPRFTAPTGVVLAIADPVGVPTLIESITDLTPFLFPSRWIDFAKKKSLSEAERIFLATVRANATFNVQTLLAGIQRTKKILLVVDSELSLLEKMFHAVTKKIPLDDDADNMISVRGIREAIKEMEIYRSTFQDELRDQIGLLAEGVGLETPDQIEDVRFENKTSDFSPLPFGLHAIQKLAVHRSPEIKQIEKQIEALKSDKSLSLLSWLDPVGNADNALGIGMPDKYASVEAQIRSLEASRKKAISSLHRKAIEGLQNMDRAKVEYQLNIEKQSLNKEVIDLLNDDLDKTDDIDPAALVIALRNRLGVRIALADRVLLYQIGFSQLQRLLLEGPYAETRFMDPSLFNKK